MKKQFTLLLVSMMLLTGCLGSLAKTETVEQDTKKVTSLDIDDNDKALVYVMEKRIQQRRLDQALSSWETQGGGKCEPILVEHKKEPTCEEMMNLFRKKCQLPPTDKITTETDILLEPFIVKNPAILDLEE
jgi:hypothetical protein